MKWLRSLLTVIAVRIRGSLGTQPQLLCARLGVRVYANIILFEKEVGAIICT